MFYKPHLSLNRLTFTLGGQTVTREIDFGKMKYIDLYLDFLETVRDSYLPKKINYSSFSEGYTMLCLNLSPEHVKELASEQLSGQCNLNLRSQKIFQYFSIQKVFGRLVLPVMGQ